MRSMLVVAILVFLAPAVFAESPADGKVMFNGENLEGWRGRSDLWAVVDGAIVGTTTAENPLKGNTFLIYDGDVPANFELTAMFLIQGGNSGIQYRSRVVDEAAFVVSGYQADIDDALKFAGINYEEKGRGILALRGEKVTIAEDGKKTKEQFGDAAKLGESIHGGQWNSYRVVANGPHLQHFINDVLTSEVVDGEPAKASSDGIIALQVHAGPPMVVKFKDLKIKPIAE